MGRLPLSTEGRPKVCSHSPGVPCLSLLLSPLGLRLVGTPHRSQFRGTAAFLPGLPSSCAAVLTPSLTTSPLAPLSVPCVPCHDPGQYDTPERAVVHLIFSLIYSFIQPPTNTYSVPGLVLGL